MLMAVTSDAPDLNGTVPPRFSESPYLLIVDMEQEILQRVLHRDAGQDSAFARAMVDAGCEGVLCGPIERDPFLIIADQGCITRYDAAGMTVLDALTRMSRRELPLLKDHLGGEGCQSSRESHAGECRNKHA